MARFILSSRQADAILEMRLRMLTALEVDKLESEAAELRKTIAYLESILASEKKQYEVIKKDFLDGEEEVRRSASLGDPGRCRRHERRRPDPLKSAWSSRSRTPGTSSAPRRTSTASSVAVVRASSAPRPRRGLGRTPLHRHDAQLPDVLHEQGTGALAQGVGNPAGGRATRDA